jgi:ribosomal protein L21E
MKDYKKNLFKVIRAPKTCSKLFNKKLALKDNFSELRTGQLVGVQIDPTFDGPWHEAPTRSGHIMAPHPTLQGKYGVHYDDGGKELEVPRYLIHIETGTPNKIDWRRPEHLRAPITF